ncbi:MAG TPA: cytochrome c biogenesis protein CcsA [bacterium]|nr:cytochrome c biogenesis protein CcsA [bacterium]
MIALLRDTVAGLTSGTAYATSVAGFDLAFMLFLLATAAYMIYLAARKDVWWKIGFGASSVAALSMTLALILRWVAAGWDHPPFTNLYESLVFFAWGIVVFYLFVEWKYKIRLAGAFIVPLACVTMGLASLSPSKEIEPLVPALQSIWLHLHVAVASIGYAAFLAAFAFAVLFFLKDRVSLKWFLVTASAFVIFAVLAASRGAVLPAANFYFDLPEMTGMGVHTGKVPLPGVGPLLLLAMLAALAAFIQSVSDIVRKKNETSSLAFTLFLVVFGVMTAALIWLLVQTHRVPHAHLGNNPYAFAMLVIAWLMSLMVVIFHLRYEAILNALPEVKIIDRLTYNTIMIGFPLMTLVIITGAIWANKAWGRYWGWDPKETASLVTWGIYLLYLHTRLTQGWQGRRSMIIAVIGFVSVVFTYLGVNLLLSGLHAYATG